MSNKRSANALNIQVTSGNKTPSKVVFVSCNSLPSHVVFKCDQKTVDRAFQYTKPFPPLGAAVLVFVAMINHMGHGVDRTNFIACQWRSGGHRDESRVLPTELNLTRRSKVQEFRGLEYSR